MERASCERKPVPEGPFDLVVVGGGINGAGIARDAVLRGLSVALFDKGDLAGGTSSVTSKMVHGGIRYLEQLDFGLVYEALRERTCLLRLAPHLVRPQSFVMPLYAGGRRGRRWVGFGLRLYDLLALGRRLGRARILSPQETAARLPVLESQGLVGGGLYFDAVMDDARLCIANAVAAREAGAEQSVPFVLRTRTEVLSIRPTSPITVVVRDRILGREQQVLAHRVVKALGPWSDASLLTASRGAHIVLPPLPVADGLLLEHSRDHRVYFVVPWKGLSLVGTTESPANGSPDGLRPSAEEIEYLLGEAQRLFPTLRLTRRDILGAFVGVRPLARRHGLLARLRRNGLGGASRRHRIVAEGGGIFSVVGGKFTTYRALAEEALNQILGVGGCRTRSVPLPGGEDGPWDDHRKRIRPEDRELFAEEELHRLFRRYGCRYRGVTDLVRRDPALGRPVVEGAPDLRAEVVYSIRDELVLYPEDFLDRRSALRFVAVDRRKAYLAVEAILGEHLRPPPPDLDLAREQYLDALEWEEAVCRPSPSSTSP